MIHKLPRDYKSMIKRGLVIGAILAAVYFFITIAVAPRMNALSYAWMNPEKVAWLQEGDKKANADSQLKLKEAISRLFINDVNADDSSK